MNVRFKDEIRGNRHFADHVQVAHDQNVAHDQKFWIIEKFEQKIDFGEKYNHTLLIPTKSSKSKYQVVHEHKFKDLLSSTCQVSAERIVLDLESEVLRGPGSIPTGANILSLDFSHVAKPPMPILSNLSKTRVEKLLQVTRYLSSHLKV